jgi:hypothetical protein
MLHSQARDGLIIRVKRPDYSGQDMTAEWRKLQIINFSKECCPNATWRQQAVVCILRRSV